MQEALRHQVRPATLRFLRSVQDLALMEECAKSLDERRKQYELISESYDAVIQDCIERGEDLRNPEDRATALRRIGLPA